MNSIPLPSPPRSPAGDIGYGGGDTGSTGKITEARQKISRTAHDAADKLKSTASEKVSRVKQQAQGLVTEKKESAAGRIGGYSSALHESARSFEEQDPNIAHFAHLAADRVQRVADYVRSCDYTGLRRDAEDFARRHPAAFFGGLFTLGLILGNVATASRRREHETSAFESEHPEDWTRQETGMGSPAYASPNPAPLPEL